MRGKLDILRLALLLSMSTMGCGDVVPLGNQYSGSDAGGTAGGGTTGTGADGGHGGSSSQGGSTDGSSGGETDTGGNGPKLDVGSGDTGGNAQECLCAPKSDLVFLLTQSKELWTYDPPSNALAMLTTVGCDTQFDLSATTFSMGVGRDGRAWVQYANGDLYTIQVNDPGQCEDPGFMADQQGMHTFGMGFVSNSQLDPCDRLYGIDAGIFSSGLLASLDTADLQFEPIKTTSYRLAELAGTGDGRLFALVQDPMNGDVDLIELDRATGDEIEVFALTDLNTGGNFAFSFWGGDFYFFTDGPMGSTISRLDWDESEGNGKQLEVVLSDSPISVVGAGTSTCVPLEPEG